MALLQLSEPDTASQQRSAIGIDLGTTNSLVAKVEHGQPKALSDEQGRTLLPSVVRYLPNGEVQLGYEAQAAQIDDPQNTIISVKRLLGRGLKDIAGIQNLPYEFHEAPGMVQLKTIAGIKSPVEVSAHILACLRQIAETALACSVFDAVITVPAYFDDAQRQATKDAAHIAGLNVLRLLNEPTAAAVAYGLDQGAQGIFAVYDLGGGTFDISILKLQQGVFEVLATGGDAALGGDDFDQLICDWIGKQARLAPLSKEEMRALTTEARLVKERLSSTAQTTIDISLSSGAAIHLSLTANEFAALTQHLVAKTINISNKTLRDAGLTINQIDGVVLVGGATRMPHVRQAVADFFQTTPLSNIDPDRVVALGAAMQAHLLAGNSTSDNDWLLLDVIPLSLGIETMGGLVEKIIPRNATIPCAYTQEFTTFKDGQTALAIHVVQGERELVADCRSLARFELHGIPPMAAGAARIRVTYQVDADGLLFVSAREMTTDVQASITVRPSYGLTDEQIAQMLQNAFQTADDDMEQRALKEQQIEAERLVLATQAALENDSALLSKQERTNIVQLIDAVREQLARHDRQALEMEIKALAHGTEVFAERRMDRDIRAALAGKRLDEVS